MKVNTCDRYWTLIASYAVAGVIMAFTAGAVHTPTYRKGKVVAAGGRVLLENGWLDWIALWVIFAAAITAVVWLAPDPD